MNSTSSSLGSPPQPVSNLNVVLSNNNTTATLNWSSVSQATGYVVESRANTQTKFTVHGISNSTSYTINNLDQAMVYFFRITAFNTNGYTSHNEQVTIPNPVAPNNVKILMIAGQSNAQGYGDYVNTSIDTCPPGVLQYCIGDQYSQGKSRPGTVQPFTTEPMDDNDRADLIGHSAAFARAYKNANPNDTLIMINVAVSSAGFINSSRNWTVNTGNVFTRARNAMQTLRTQYPDAQWIGISWLQGESDRFDLPTNYKSNLLAVFNAFRQVAGSNIPICVLSMVPEWIQGENGAQAIQRVHQAIPSLLPYTSFAFGPTGYASTNNDTIHYNAAGQRVLGSTLYNSLATARNNVRPVPTQLQLVSRTTTSVTISFEGSGSSFTVNYTSGTTQTQTANGSPVTISNLTPNTTYSIQISATHPSGTSSLSQALNVKTEANQQQPNPPTNTTPTLNLRSSSISLGNSVETISDSGYTFNFLTDKPVRGELNNVPVIRFSNGQALVNTTMTYTTKTTFMMMFNWSGLIGGNFQNFFSTANTNSSLTLFALLLGTVGSPLQLFNNSSLTNSSLIPQKEKWYVVFCVFDSTTNSAIMYANGTEVARGSCVITNASAYTGVTLNGMYNGTNLQNSFPFDMTEFTVWRDVVLSPTEISTRTSDLAAEYDVVLG